MVSEPAFAIRALGRDLAVAECEDVHEVDFEAPAVPGRAGGHRLDRGVLGTDEVPDLIPAYVGHPLDQVLDELARGCLADGTRAPGSSPNDASNTTSSENMSTMPSRSWAFQTSRTAAPTPRRQTPWPSPPGFDLDPAEPGGIRPAEPTAT